MKRILKSLSARLSAKRTILLCCGITGILACGDGGSSGPSFEFSFDDFLTPSQRIARFEDDVEGDLPQSGSVTLRYETERTMRRRFCLQSKDDIHHTQVLRNAAGTELLRMNTADAEKCRVVDLSPGAYSLSLSHDGVSNPASVQIVGKDRMGVE